jgi:hypothetical protein
MTLYRKPKDYLPPYDYCDRWCSRCNIDKTRCEVYQQEMQTSLEHLAEGVDPADLNVVVADIQKSFDKAVLLLREKGKQLGIDLDRVDEGAAAPSSRPRAEPPEDPIVGRAKAIMHGCKDVMNDLDPGPREVVAWYSPQVVVKLHRATADELEDELDEEDRADVILQAQVAHRGLVRIMAALGDAGRARPRLMDALLEPLAASQRLMREIEERWLSKPNDRLAQVTGDEWWGPLRIAPSLKPGKRSK